MRKYAILYDANAPARMDAASPRSRLLTFDATAERPPEPRLEVQRLDSRHIPDLFRDPAVVDLAPVMPTRLIAPVSDGEADARSCETAWGLSAVGADQSAFTGDGVVVAVLDTGIDAGHEAFRGVTLDEEDFSGDGHGDADGHGTHVAGTIFGRDVGGTRIGVAPGIKRALIGKVLKNDGSGGSDMLYRGIQWAMNGGANVISMSLGFDFPGLVKELIDEGMPADLATSWALEAYRINLRLFDSQMGLIRARTPLDGGIVTTAAAGNESKRRLDPDYEIAVSMPAAAEGILSVGALAQGTDGLTIASFSNTFPTLCAPGVGIRSAKVGGGLTNLNGTSMACPHASGVAALWWEAVRQQSLSATGSLVTANLLASARTDGIIAHEVGAAARGAGIVTAP